MGIVEFIFLFVLILSKSNSGMANDSLSPQTTVKYAWQLNAVDKDKLFNGIRSLRYGDSIVDIRKLLGHPIAENDNYAKVPLNKFTAHVLTYGVKKNRYRRGKYK